ncbi:MAG: undecaprenyldiphospho-muramoylpentapeptide beta-N-acetylglucosaminyltransferase [Oscillospiraceae bacterium]|nr:undecaprenyldiphospho-muramoylpentapeptide beta-N-acetylglucosaminyltransferase [Oscillospiraceae bacterium]
MKILFTCGGTAGHINPAVSLARMFQARNKGCEVLFVGAEGGMECKLVPKEGYRIETVKITNFKRSLHPKAIGHNVTTIWNVRRSRKRANAILDEFTPDLVVGTGGYASFPVVQAAAKRGIPTAVHESNVVPGLTTKTLAAVVDRVMVGFAESAAHYEQKEKVVVTGTPVRAEFFRYTRKEARAQLGVDDARPILLSFFGSLGAEVMNGYMEDFFRREQEHGYPYHHIHSVGTYYDAMQKRAPDDPAIDLRQYIYDMPLVMAAADLVLCRAGSSTMAELAAIAKPSVLVPSPNVVADHQTKNAEVFVQAGGAVMVKEADCTPESLWETISGLLDDEAARENMSRALRAMVGPDAAEQIYQTLLALLEEKRKTG